ncbi:MAG: serine/threonine protein kinase [Xanthomonadales bacterium]|nr:serine/threonine protein kinase [Xanthomonadales bacterium]
MDDTAEGMEQIAAQLYAECRALDEDARSQWLDQHCGDDAELRAAVEQLLVQTSVVGDRPAISNGHPGDRRGERVGAFELLEAIGAGGMGQVYRARRIDGSFEQEVAIKLYSAGYLLGVGRERFHAERQILACLEHPGIARVIDGGDAADGTPYMAMELVRGQSITDWCNAHSVGLRGRLQIFAKVCEAVEVAHRRGVVHRDIKPGNVLVDQNGQPKIIDFGIAKVLDADAVGVQAPWTATHLQLLTPEYASPEQVRGLPIDHASDVYSLGVLLYELLTGGRPYQLAARSPVEIERTICQSMPADPSTQVARSGLPALPGLPAAASLRRLLRGDLDRIVMTALRKEADQRYRSAAALGDDIERHLAGQPVTARGASRWYRLGKFVQRHRAASLAVLGIFAALLIGLLAVSLQARQAREQAARAEAAKDFLISMISQADPFENAGEATLAAALQRAIPEIGERFAAQPELQAELRYAIGFALEGLGLTEQAKAQLTRALQWYEQGEDPVPLARTLTALARVSWADSDYRQGEAQLQQALALLEGLDSDAARKARYDALADLGALLPKMDEFARAEQVTRQALDLRDSVPGVRAVDGPVLWNNLATALEGQGDLTGAMAAYERSIALHRALHPAHPDLAIALGNLGMSYESQGDLPRAIAMVAEAAAMQDDLLGPQHPDALLMRYNPGSLQLNAGQLPEAADNLQRAAAGAAQAYAADHLYTGRFQHRLAEALLALGRSDEAAAAAAEAAAIYSNNDEVPEHWREALAELRRDLPTG